MFFPISPPNASISRTRCPFELPPIFGLQGINAILSTLTVNMTVFMPSLALARAASQPAWPAPITTTSTYSSTTLLIILHILSDVSFYLPIQKRPKISLIKSSPTDSPMIFPKDSYALIRSME